jgi:hypothetical protein
LGRRSNIESGEPEYPVLNPNPKVIIHFTVIAPSSIPNQLSAGYVAQADSVQNQTPSTCWYGTGLGVIHRFSVTEAIPLKRDGAYLSG